MTLTTQGSVVVVVKPPKNKPKHQQHLPVTIVRRCVRRLSGRLIPAGVCVESPSRPATDL